METKYQAKIKEKRERKMVRESARTIRKQRMLHSLRTLKSKVFNVKNDVLGLMFLTAFATTGALIWCAYLFSFRNVQGLGAYLGVPDNLSVLVAPMLDTFLLFLVSVNLIFVLSPPSEDSDELQKEHASAMTLFRWAMLGVGVATLVLNASYALFVVEHAGYAIFEGLPSTVFILLIEGVLRLTRLFAVMNRSYEIAKQSEIEVQSISATQPEIAMQSVSATQSEIEVQSVSATQPEIAMQSVSATQPEIAMQSVSEISPAIPPQSVSATQSEIATGVIPIKRGNARTAIEAWLQGPGMKSSSWLNQNGTMKLNNAIAADLGVSASSICRHTGFKNQRSAIAAEIANQEIAQ